MLDSGGSSEARIRWGAHWPNLANAIEPSVCGGDAAFLSDYFDRLSNIPGNPGNLLEIYKVSWIFSGLVC